jgi:TRAP-type C4-dicarboxylate transport system permease small subunit
MQDKGMHKKLSAIGRKLARFEDAFLIFIFIAMAITLFLQVIFRYSLNMPLVWSEELSRYLLVWITFLGINFGIRRNKHIKMEIVFNLIPPNFQTIAAVGTQIFIILTILYFLGGAVRFVAAQKNIGSSAMQVNMGLVYMVIPISFGITAVNLLVDTVRKIFVIFNSFQKR